MRRLALVLALLVLIVTRVHAADTPDPKVDEAKAKLLEVLLDEAKVDDRVKAAGDLASLDKLPAAKAVLESLDKLAARTAQVETRAAKTRADYEGYKGAAQATDKDWDIKKRLLEDMEHQEAVLAGDGRVLDAFGSGVAAMKDKEAIAFLDRAAMKDDAAVARRVLDAALLRNPATSAPEIAKRGMSDADATVRLAVLQAFADRKDRAFLDPSIKALSDPAWAFRQAAARALAALGDAKAVVPIITAMAAEDGRLLEDYADALSKLTGASLGPNPDAWKRWYDDHKAELAAKGAGAAAPKPSKAGPLGEAMDYYGIKTRSRKLMFLIDCSGSMNEVIGQAGVVTGGGMQGKKIDIAKTMLKAAIARLDPGTSFNVIVFNTDARQLAEGMVKATDDEKFKMNERVDELVGRGGTYTYGALRLAFGLANPNATPSAPAVDTIFLLSDGAPTEAAFEDAVEAKPMDPEKILSSVKQWNPFRAVKIHTIAIDPRLDSHTVGAKFVTFMRTLAEQNGGTYTAVGGK
jgi:HEAT repeat protein